MADLIVRPRATGGFEVIDPFAGVAPQAHASADAAIEAAIASFGREGGELRLARGDYALGHALRVPSRVVLSGSGRATRLLVSAGDGVLLENVDGAVVRDVAVHARHDDARRGVILDACGDCRVQDVFAEGFAEAGVWLGNSSFLCELRGVRAAGNRRAGIVVDDLWIGRGGEWVPCLLSNCIVYGGGHGIEFRRAIVVNVVGCAVHQSGGHAYYLRDSSNSVVLSGCRSFQVGGDAVHVDGSHEFNATGNIFCWHRGDGIVLRDVAWATIAGNNVIDSGVRVPDGGLRRGIVIAGDTRGAQVTGNALFNWGDQCPMAEGIVEEPTAHDNAVVGNNINYTAGAALDCHGARSTVASNVAVAAAAHVSMGRPPYPDFTLTKLHAFIDAQR